MRYQRHETVQAGSSKTIVLPKDLDSLPITLQLSPGASGTLAAYASCDDIVLLEQAEASASWTALSPASVTASSIITISTPVSAIKVTATTSAGVVNILTFRVPYSF